MKEQKLLKRSLNADQALMLQLSNLAMIRESRKKTEIMNERINHMAMKKLRRANAKIFWLLLALRLEYERKNSPK